MARTRIAAIRATIIRMVSIGIERSPPAVLFFLLKLENLILPLAKRGVRRENPHSIASRHFTWPAKAVGI